MTTNENILPNDGDIKPMDNHASGIEIKPLDDSLAPGVDITPMDNHASGIEIKPLDKQASGEDIVAMDNHASGTRP
ncbi:MULTISPECIES: hypothetical protein [unclassified Streptomyces]|uniref:Uncharacterized protein n=1 Tax=Streptomyces sp. R33 TaxID=3238629 RepID=A0AB39Y805_9ACTN|nr:MULTISPECIES: hypothetical protein [unclassified Streptomyces]KJY45353.1 hypothetical protein VR46_15220 [Streptomyces sp. NRRL S-444]KOY53545.1 hypothetical protein ADK59_35170 [Streptomyces sp. XY332]TDU77628.1 hypothetical protein EDD91_4387 [Streptomyces sp. KS 21]THA37009.1 hypothetical protein E6W17_23580 [Streptomyces sp. A1547]